MLSDKQETFNTFSLKPVEENLHKTDVNDLNGKQPSILSLQQLESAFKQLPTELVGATTGINDLLQNMNTILQDSGLKNMLQSIDHVLKKTKSEKMNAKWKLIELEDEHIIYVELENVIKENLTLQIVDNIVTIKIQPVKTELEQETVTHSITLPYRIDATEVKAYYSPTLIDIHIPKKRIHTIPLLDRTPKETKK